MTFMNSPFFAGQVLPQELELVLERLSEMFGPNLHFLPPEQQRAAGPLLQLPSFGQLPPLLNFHVWNMTDDVLFHELEKNQDQLFGDDLHKFQILRPYGRSSDRGVFLRFLPTGLRAEYKTGFWYY
jgi:hypothetical protein